MIIIFLINNMINIQDYYLKFYNENKSNYESNILYKTLHEKIEKLRKFENESFYEKNGKENDMKKIKEFISQIKNFILENNKEYNSSINQNFILYYQSIKNFYATLFKNEFGIIVRHRGNVDTLMIPPYYQRIYSTKTFLS